ncbi:pilus assembly protein TadG-related protein [Sulfitobacter sp. HNIBRBA2951]|uniref:pilus assembly protein TadG-related protein n=1 Tax=Sulfitobacter aquimarinus TaxID=3158557 RepID=UPI0032E01629
MLRINPKPDFQRDEDGAVAVIVALLLVVLLGFTALGVDVASLYRARAQLQSLSDLSAMSAVAHIDEATSHAQLAMTRNSADSDALESLEFGRYLRNPALPAQDRFQVLAEGSAGINAVRLVAQQDAPLHFARIFTDQSSVNLNRTSTASRTGLARFSLDSHLVNIGSGALNDIITQEFGVNAAITAGDMQLLSATSISAGALLEALNLDVGRNPAEILNAETSGGAFIQALQSLLPPALAPAVAGLRTAAAGTSFDVSSLISGIDTELGLTATQALLATQITALDAVNALVAAQTVGDTSDIDLNLSVAGILSTQTAITAGEPAAESGWIAMGEEGAQLHRAAMRVETRTQIAPSLLGGFVAGIEIASVDLPIYAELAGATASLETLACKGARADDLAARFLTAPTPLHPQNGTAVAALYLGHLPDTGGPIDPAEVEFADLLDVNLTIPSLLPLVPDITLSGITIQARSHVAVGTSETESITFTHADIAQGRTVKTFGSVEMLSSATASLLSPQSTELRVKPGQTGLITGLAAPLVDVLLATLPDRLLATLSAPVDSVLDATLAGIGVKLGEGELELKDHHCETIRLVQ